LAWMVMTLAPLVAKMVLIFKIESPNPTRRINDKHRLQWLDYKLG